MTDIEWAEPPPQHTHSGSSKNDGLREQLRANPGKWALYKKAGISSGIASQVNNGGGLWGPKGTFDATTRYQADKTFDIYIRYVGDPS